MSYACPIAVTGVGVLSPLADDASALMSALYEGRSALSNGAEKLATSRIVDFDARCYANIRGMRVYPRNTQLQICAAVLALGHAGLEPSQLDPLALGTVTASTYAHLETLLEYDYHLVTLGIQRTNPTLFPLALPSAPGALTALSLGAKAFAITLSDGGGSGVSAVAHAARLLAQGRAQVCVVVSAAAECAELVASTARAGMLSDRENFRAFDRQSRGTALGELAVALVLETAAHARARGHEPLGYVRGAGAAFASQTSALHGALVRAGETALHAAGVKREELGLVAASASGLREQDEAEARALHSLLGEARTTVGVTALKSLLGEALDASGIWDAAAALLALRSGLCPAIARLREPHVSGLRYLTETSKVDGPCALLTSISATGACSALVVARSHDDG